MLPSSITIGLPDEPFTYTDSTGATSEGSVTEYSLQRINPTNSVYGDASAPASTPRTLRVSHEVAGDGTINTALILDDLHDLPGATAKDQKVQRAMVKLVYHPDYSTKEQVREQYARLALLLLTSLAPKGTSLPDLTVKYGVADQLLYTPGCESGCDLQQLLNLEH